MSTMGIGIATFGSMAAAGIGSYALLAKQQEPNAPMAGAMAGGLATTVAGTALRPVVQHSAPGMIGASLLVGSGLGALAGSFVAWGTH